MTEPQPIRPEPKQSDDVRWLALTIRQGLKLIVVAIEKKYGLESDRDKRAA